jgi:hypothetical protein
MTNVVDLLDAECLSGTQFIKTAYCKLCGQKVFGVSDRPTEAEVRLETFGLRSHFEIAHGISLGFRDCSDPGCADPH